MTLELRATNWGTEHLRDAFSLNARLFDDDDYIQFVVVGISGLGRETVFPGVEDDDLAAALLHFASEPVAAALADGRIPLKDPSTAYEVRVERGDYERFREFIVRAQELSNQAAPVQVVSEPMRELELSSLRLSSLEVRNLYSFGPHSGDEVTEIRFEQGATVLIGPNGAGKSNIFFALAFARDQMLGRRASPRDTPRFIGAPAASFTDVRMQLEDASGLTATIGSQFDDSGALIQQQVLVGKRDIATVSYQRWTGSVRWLTNEESGGAFLNEESDAQRGSAMRSIIEFDRAHPNLTTIYQFLEELRVYREWRTQSSDRSGHPNDARFTTYLNQDFSNLSGVLSRLLKDGPLRERLFLEVGQILPGFEDIEIERLEVDLWFAVIDGRKVPAESLSDGTVQYLTLIALLLDPNAKGPLLLDEPDVLLHPDAVLRLARLIDDVCAAGRQVVVATHNPSLLDVIADEYPERVRVVESSRTGTLAKALDAGALDLWLEEFTLGEAWGRRAFGGNP